MLRAGLGLGSLISTITTSQCQLPFTQICSLSTIFWHSTKIIILWQNADEQTKLAHVELALFLLPQLSMRSGLIHKNSQRVQHITTHLVI